MIKLTKNIRRTYNAGSAGVPDQPGQPYAPARDVTTAVNVCNPTSASALPAGYTYKVVPPNPNLVGSTGGAVLYYNGVPVSGAMPKLNQTGSSFGCTTQYVTTHIAEQPYIPPHYSVPPVAPSVTSDFNLGWNSGAISKGVITRNGRITFSVFSATGVVVGLNNQKLDYGYTNIPFGLMFGQGAVQVVERGALVGSTSPFTADNVFEIRRVNRVASYWVDGVMIYESAEPAPSGPMFMDVSMYTGGDEIDPFIGDFQDSENTFLPMGGVAGDATTSDYAYSAGGFTYMTGVSYPFSTGEGSFPPMTGLAGVGAYGAAVNSFETMTGEGGDVFVPPYAIAAGVFSYMTAASGYGRSGLGGGMNESFQPMSGYAGKGTHHAGTPNPGRGFEPMFGFAHAYEGNLNAYVSEFVFALDSITRDPYIAVVMNSNLTVATAFLVQHLKNADASDSAEVTDTMSVNQILNAIMDSLVTVNFDTPGISDECSVWVVNAANSASTRYENFNFNSYARFGDAYYGMRTDGLYQLDGDSDDSDPIRSMISLGKRDFHTPKLKHMPHAYIGVSSTGKMFLKVIANGQTYIYSARAYDPNLKLQRIDTGKGLRANYFELELYNSDGADFELSSVEFTAVATDRRI